MSIVQIKVPVKHRTNCSECTSVRGVIDKAATISGSGVLVGTIVPRIEDNNAMWREGDQYYVNFEYNNDQLHPNTILKPCDICLVCGCVVDLIEGLVGSVRVPIPINTPPCPTGGFIGSNV